MDETFLRFDTIASKVIEKSAAISIPLRNELIECEVLCACRKRPANESL